MQRRGVVLFLRSLDSDFQRRIRDDALSAAATHGFAITTISSLNDAGRQAAQIEAALEGAPIPGLKESPFRVQANGAAPESELSAIFVAPVREESLEDLARRTLERNLVWGLLNREASYIATLHARSKTIPIFAVAPDQWEIGRLQAAQAKALAPEGGTIIIITGPAKTATSRRRVEGLWGELGPNYALTLLEADWTTECARLVMDRWLQRIERSALPCVIAAQNDDMALGARQALRDAASAHGAPELLKLPIIGCDGSPGFGQRLVSEHRLAATIFLPSPSAIAFERLAAFRDHGEMSPHQLTLPVTSLPLVRELSASLLPADLPDLPNIG